MNIQSIVIKGALSLAVLCGCAGMAQAGVIGQDCFDINGNVMARMNGAEGNSIIYGPAVEGTEYILVIRLSKSVAGSQENYDRLKFWVNPSGDDQNAPEGILEMDTRKRGFSWVGIRNVNTEKNDVFSVDDITLATSWADVVQPAL